MAASSFCSLLLCPDLAFSEKCQQPSCRESRSTYYRRTEGILPLATETRFGAFSRATEWRILVQPLVVF
uniref:Putative secreted protein n=1 Tax=Anopheles triannulatus TaxID=58253 RepID=A0A2M4B844_9DIPT